MPTLSLVVFYVGSFQDIYSKIVTSYICSNNFDNKVRIRYIIKSEKFNYIDVCVLPNCM